MGRALTTAERAQRQRVMMKLRSWMEQNKVPRQEIADQLGITRGHLSTLINANRTPTDAQVEIALEIMDLSGPILPWKKAKKPKAKKPKSKKPKSKKPKVEAEEPHANRRRRTGDLRPLTEFEAKFIAEIARSWISSNKDASQEDFVEVVRALSIGIRS